MARRPVDVREVRHGGENYRRAGTYQTRPMRPSDEDEEVVIEHKGSGWYRVRRGEEVLEESVRGKENAQSIKQTYT